MKPDLQKMGFFLQQSHAAADEQTLFDGICEDAAEKKDMARMQPFGFYIKDVIGVVYGGANGVIYYGCLYIDMLWVKKTLRNQGFGRLLVEEAEKLAGQSNCTFATVNTMDWEALTFYQNLGYQIEFVREGYDRDSKMYFLKKML